MWGIPHANATTRLYIDGLVQERRNSGALAMELRLSWTNPYICLSLLLANQKP